MEDLYMYIRRVGIALSVLLNVILGGYSNQTFSARNYEWKRQGKPNIVWLIDGIFLHVFSDANHCMNSWSYWVIRKELTLDNNIWKSALCVVPEGEETY